MIILDYRDRRPLYEQVAERFEELMFKGVLSENSKLPSVRTLATELSINPNTIQRAYGELERRGYTYSIKGKGNFVADSTRLREGKLGAWKEQLEALAKEGIKLGVGAEEMTELIEETYRGYLTERGENHD